MNELGTSRNKMRENQAVSDDIQTSISLIKYELQNPIRQLMTKNDYEKIVFGETVIY